MSIERVLPPPPIPGSPFAAYQPPRYTKPNNTLTIAVVLLCLAGGVPIVLAFAFAMRAATQVRLATPPAPTVKSARDYHTAWYQESCRRVKLLLKSPASAEFPGKLSRDYSIDYSTPGHVTVRSYVDAQNSFDAKLRQTWVVQLKHDASFSNTTVMYIRLGPDMVLDLRPRRDG